MTLFPGQIGGDATMTKALDPYTPSDAAVLPLIVSVIHRVHHLVMLRAQSHNLINQQQLQQQPEQENKLSMIAIDG